MSGLMRRVIGELDRLPRSVEQSIDAARYQGLVSAAKVNAAAFVTHTAMTYVAGLSAEEARLVQQCPLAEPRLKSIVDHFTGMACAEIAGMAW